MEKDEPGRSLMTAAAVGLVGLNDGNETEPRPKKEKQIPEAQEGPSGVADEDEAGNARIFPQRLYDILSDERNAACIGWLPHGQGFIIKNRKRFAAEVLPRYFKQTKYTSFTRKLNRWDFTRVTRGPELGAYYHKFFRRGEPTLCTQMYCKNERAKFAAKQQQQPQKTAEAAAAATPLTVPPAAPEHVPVEQKTVPLPVEPRPVAEPQQVAVPQQQQQQHSVPSLPKIHPSLLLSPRAKMILATQMAAQAQMQHALDLAQAQQVRQHQQQQHPASSTNDIVNAAVRALYNGSNAQQTPSEFSVAALHQRQRAAAARMAQVRAAMQQHQQQQAMGTAAAAMPKLPPSQATMAQARVARAGRGSNSPSNGASFRASAA